MTTAQDEALRVAAEHAAAIRATLDPLWRPNDLGQEPDWTRGTFAALAELGRTRYGFDSQYSTRCGGPGEIMWDYRWCQRDATGALVAVPLVAESEWVWRTGIIHDFEKLLPADAPLRLMIFQAPSATQVRDFFQDFERRARLFRGRLPAHYLAAGWVCEEREGLLRHPLFHGWTT
jgi:hypothetical protein